MEQEIPSDAKEAHVTTVSAVYLSMQAELDEVSAKG